LKEKSLKETKNGSRLKQKFDQKKPGQNFVFRTNVSKWWSIPITSNLVDIKRTNCSVKSMVTNFALLPKNVLDRIIFVKSRFHKSFYQNFRRAIIERPKKNEIRLRLKSYTLNEKCITLFTLNRPKKCSNGHKCTSFTLPDIVQWAKDEPREAWNTFLHPVSYWPSECNNS